jgi:hypothetical protein
MRKDFIFVRRRIRRGPLPVLCARYTFAKELDVIVLARNCARRANEQRSIHGIIQIGNKPCVSRRRVWATVAPRVCHCIVAHWRVFTNGALVTECARIAFSCIFGLHSRVFKRSHGASSLAWFTIDTWLAFQCRRQLGWRNGPEPRVAPSHAIVDVFSARAGECRSVAADCTGDTLRGKLACQASHRIKIRPHWACHVLAR